MGLLCKRFVCIAPLVICLALCSFISSNSKTSIDIVIEHTAGQKLLGLDTVTYHNALGQEFTVSRFRYYISNIALKNVRGVVTPLPGYYLVDEAEASSKNLHLTRIPEGPYTSISFVIGVDSLHNCSGAESGPLDPVNGMFWTWSTGYIFLKLEGNAATSASPGHIFEYHIGGYSGANNCIRTVTLPLKGFKTEAQGTAKIYLKADVLKILQGKTPVDFSKLSSVTDFHHAADIADNYAGMFSVINPQ